ncbi:unnamed protein product [Ilex paraguariensis]|uniref:Uncharacterized protein n=1 Tax=Ilex paraguariensis TaxID=185542 RepID=A0ABC8SPN4_9AQUA
MGICFTPSTGTKSHFPYDYKINPKRLSCIIESVNLFGLFLWTLIWDCPEHGSYGIGHEPRGFVRYDIQLGVHDPYENFVSVIRLYKRMCAQDHQVGEIEASMAAQHTHSIDYCSSKDLEKMTPDELFEISRSNYRC